MAAASTAPGKAKAPPKCRICGKDAPCGAALCPQCKAAVKRARQVPTLMSRFMPLAMSGTGSGPARSGTVGVAHTRAAPPRRPQAKPAGWSAFVGVAAFGLAVCVTGYFTALQTDEDAGPANVMSAASVAGHGASRPRLASPPAADLPEGPGPTFAAMPTAGSALPSASGKAPIRRSTTGRGAGAERAPTTASGPPMDADEATASTGAPEGAAALPAAPPAPEPAVLDRWQAMGAAIERCGQESFFAGVICEQRVRLRYCEGYWGEVPQCGRGFRFDSGR
jgi:hypothetical protein